ncbi:hypothetical protein GQ55_3G175500 [Panicum hallii var. hallii]|uniref:Uncharacterized protein n=1 Tax=Panicum hallii var. hallii TaxID=1504633 RepID=A0A2T7EAI7_9POAL|nr:hypothetical protein GQ55_3G175500 [Panicum hallii var. hallii]
MDLETENRLASLLLEEARRLQLEADREGVHAYLRKPNVRHRPNSRFLTATVRGVQQANRVVEVNEMWRAREKELELESKVKSRSSKSKDLDDSRGEKRKSDSRNHSSSSRVEQEGITYSNSYSDQEDGLGDDEIERFLHSRVKRGRGAVGSRMDALDLLSHHKDEPSPDIRVEEKWERRVQGPEKPSFLRSKSPDDYWHKEVLDGKPSSSDPHSKKEKKRKSEKKDKRDKNKEKYKKKSKNCNHHRHKSQRRE